MLSRAFFSSRYFLPRGFRFRSLLVKEPVYEKIAQSLYVYYIKWIWEQDSDLKLIYRSSHHVHLTKLHHFTSTIFLGPPYLSFQILRENSVSFRLARKVHYSFSITKVVGVKARNSHTINLRTQPKMRPKHHSLMTLSQRRSATCNRAENEMSRPSLVCSSAATWTENRVELPQTDKWMRCSESAYGKVAVDILVPCKAFVGLERLGWIVWETESQSVHLGLEELTSEWKKWILNNCFLGRWMVE